jgi:transposase
MSGIEKLATRYGVSERTILRWIEAFGVFAVNDPMQLAWHLAQQRNPSKRAISKLKSELIHENSNR